jgi:hypothetical protein
MDLIVLWGDAEVSGLKSARHLAHPLSGPMTAQRDRDMSEREIRPQRRTVKAAGLPERLFTAVNLAVFLTLLACVAVAAVLWELWH